MKDRLMLVLFTSKIRCCAHSPQLFFWTNHLNFINFKLFFITSISSASITNIPISSFLPPSSNYQRSHLCGFGALTNFSVPPPSTERKRKIKFLHFSSISRNNNDCLYSPMFVSHQPLATSFDYKIYKLLHAVFTFEVGRRKKKCKRKGILWFQCD